MPDHCQTPLNSVTTKHGYLLFKNSEPSPSEVCHRPTTPRHPQTVHTEDRLDRQATCFHNGSGSLGTVEPCNLVPVIPRKVGQGFERSIAAKASFIWDPRSGFSRRTTKTPHWGFSSTKTICQDVYMLGRKCRQARSSRRLERIRTC